MTDERSPESALRGRLADIFVPALLEGSIDALSRRLGDRATVDDPRHGRARRPDAIGALLRHVAGELAGARYEHRASTTGVDRDAAEGLLVVTHEGARREIPIAVVAERRRLREIEIRIYHAYAAGTDDAAPTSMAPRSVAPPNPAEVSGPASASTYPAAAVATLVADLFAGLRAGAPDAVVAQLERTARLVDPSGAVHDLATGDLAAYLRDTGPLDLEPLGIADDGRTACVEAVLRRGSSSPAPAMVAATRGDSGLVRELRLYWSATASASASATASAR